MKTKFFLFAGLLAACLTSCSEMDEFADNNGYTDDGKSIKTIQDSPLPPSKKGIK